MKKTISLIIAFGLAAGFIACKPVESSFSMSATYVYRLRAEFAKDATQIGLPTIEKAEVKVDSFLTAYGTKNEVGGLRSFGAGGSTPIEMQNMLFRLIEKTFDSLAAKSKTLDMKTVIDSCFFIGSEARVIFEVVPYGSNTAVLRDTIVEKLRLYFVPASLSKWVTTAENERYFGYIFEKDNVVVMLHSGGDEPTTYTIDPSSGVMTVAAIPEVPQHTLTFTTEGGKACFVSSANKQTYFLK